MKKLLYIVSASVILLSCSPEHNDNEVKPAIEKKQDNVVSETKIGLKLNEGQKWKVNDEMMVHVKIMESDIQSFQGGSLEDYKTLGGKIKNHIAKLTSACTMTGRAHEELHKWLHPFIELSEKFESSDSAATAQKHYLEIKNQMEVFNQYFE